MFRLFSNRHHLLFLALLSAQAPFTRRRHASQGLTRCASGFDPNVFGSLRFCSGIASWAQITHAPTYFQCNDVQHSLQSHQLRPANANLLLEFPLNHNL